MEKNPVIVIADPETHEFYRTLPLWDERVEIYPVATPPHHNGPLQADLVLVDCGFDDERGLCLLMEVKQRNPEIPVMFVTEAGSEEAAVAALRSSARDYIKRPVDLLEFRNIIVNFLVTKRSGFWGKKRRYLADRAIAALKTNAPVIGDVRENLLRSIRYIKENFARPISLDLMAHEGGLSKYHFCREFKKATGMTPMQFLSRMRIKRSKDLLRKGLPVSTIAMKVGFNDLSSFNRHFRSFVGLTPTEFRNSLRKDS
jgi:AraC family transcriptional regulator